MAHRLTVFVRTVAIVMTSAVLVAVPSPAAASGPKCSQSHLDGPPEQVRLTLQDTRSGITSAVVTRSENADTVVPPFTPATTDPITITSTKIDQSAQARVDIIVTNADGRTKNCRKKF
jgi:hypothetical protein